MRQDAAGILFRDPEGRILLLRRSPEIYNPGLWNLPGGRIEPGESPRKGAIREASEEAGILAPTACFVKIIVNPDTGTRYHLFTAHIPTLVPTLNWESDAWAWVHPHEMQGMRLHPGLQHEGFGAVRSRRDYPGINWTPPLGVQRAFQRGLTWHAQGHGGKGLRPATLAWARKLAAGKPITPGKARKMRAWLARHKSDLNAPAAKRGHPDYPSPGRVAWALWGGNPAVSWSNRLVAKMDAYDKRRGRAKSSSS